WRYLGETFDIHGGGRDLIFPHHENEAAQSLCAFPGSHFARVWLHNGMLLVNGEKMSKSLGNFFTAREVMEKLPKGQIETIRLLLLRTHYREGLDFSDVTLPEAYEEMNRFYRALRKHPHAPTKEPPTSVVEALCDDLNIPAALVAMRMLADAAIEGNPTSASELKASGALIGLLQEDPNVWFQDLTVFPGTGSVVVKGHSASVT